MVEISIFSLVYASPRFADWVHSSVLEFTPMIARGEAEFFFIANDPTPELLEHLVARGYSYYEHRNPPLTEEEMFRRGYGAPRHMRAVYRGYNAGVRHARGRIVVLLNSDNFVSADWLEGLLKYAHPKRVVSSSLVERWHPRFSLFPRAYHGEFGDTPDSFDREGFLALAERVKITGIELGGAYMPCLLYKETAIRAGLYPEGNLAGRTFQDVVKYGDEAFFERLRSNGLEHVTALDSIVYHLKEGESDSQDPADEEMSPPQASTSSRGGPAVELPAADPLYPVCDEGVQYLSRHLPRPVTETLRRSVLTIALRLLPASAIRVLARVRRRVLGVAHAARNRWRRIRGNGVGQ